VWLYRAAFVGLVVIGAMSNVTDVVTSSDRIILAMAIPNVVGCFVLAPRVRDELDRYVRRVAPRGIERPA
jgi:AGCS family alanine or glycine:cation symporter